MDRNEAPRKRRGIAAIAASALALVVAVPAVAIGADGDSSTSGSAAPSTLEVQQSEPDASPEREDRRGEGEERRDGRDCPFEEGGEGSSDDEGSGTSGSPTSSPTIEL